MSAALSITDTRVSAPRTPLDFDRAEGVARFFGLSRARSCSIYTNRSCDGVFEGRWSYTPRWQTIDRAPTDVEIARAMHDSVTRIAPRGQDETRVLLLDVDVHELPPDSVAPADANAVDWFLETQLSTRAKNAKKKADRRWRAGIARPVVDRICELVPVHLKTITPRGYRLTVVLSEFVPARVAAELAAAIRTALSAEHQARVESFPKIDAEGRGWFCALPLLGPNPRVKNDLVTPDGLKRNAIDELLMEQGTDAEDLALALGLELDAQEHRVLPAAPGSFVEREERPAAEGQLFGSAFAIEVRALLENGMPLGGSYSAIRRATFAAWALGYTDEQTIEAIRAWLADSKHEALHCQTGGGRKQLIAVARANLRHYANGEAQGRLERGRMRSRHLRRIFDRLIAGSPAHLTTKEKTACSTTRSTTRNCSKSSVDGTVSPAGNAPSPKTCPCSSPTCGGSHAPAATSSSARGVPRVIPSGSSPPAVPPGPCASKSKCSPEPMRFFEGNVVRIIWRTQTTAVVIARYVRRGALAIEFETPWRDGERFLVPLFAIFNLIPATPAEITEAQTREANR